MVRFYRCTLCQGATAGSHGLVDMYHLPGWLSDHDVSRARASERFLDADPADAYRPFVELRWIGKNLRVEAGYRTRHHRKLRPLGRKDKQQERVRKFGERPYGGMPSFLDALAHALEDEVLLPETLRLRGDSDAFWMLPPRNVHNDDLRAVADLPQQYVRKPIMRALEDVINHRHSRFAGNVELCVKYEPHCKN